jgi:hypothetical protein
MEFLANNPLLAVCGLVCLWPGLMFGTGWILRGLVAQRGGLPRLVWPEEVAPRRPAGEL